MVIIKNHKKNITTMLFVCSLAQGLNSGNAKIPQIAAVNSSQNSSTPALHGDAKILLCAVPAIMLAGWNLLQIKKIKETLARQSVVSMPSQQLSNCSSDETAGSIDERLKALEIKVDGLISQRTAVSLQNGLPSNASLVERDVAEAKSNIKDINTALKALTESRLSLNEQISKTQKSLEGLIQRVQTLDENKVNRSDFQLAEKKKDGKYLTLKS